MNTLLDLLPTAIEDNIIRRVSDLHIDCLVSFLMPRPHYEGRYQLIGTGFFVFSPDPTVALLMTARHVVDDFDFDRGQITVGARVLSLGNVGLRRVDPNFDIAQWELPASVLLESGLLGLHAVPIYMQEEVNQNFRPMDSFILLGYPGSRNSKLDFRNHGVPERAVLGMALHGSALNANHRIREFRYDGKARPEAWRSDMTNPPTLDGMSGCPCFRLVHDHSLSTIAVVLAGVFFSWKRQTHTLSIVSFGDPWAGQDAAKATSDGNGAD